MAVQVVADLLCSLLDYRWYFDYFDHSHYQQKQVQERAGYSLLGQQVDRIHYYYRCCS